MRIRQYPAITTMTGAEAIPVDQDNVTKHLLLSQIRGSGFFYSSGYASLDAAVTAIGATPGTLLIHAALASVGNVTVPTTLAVQFTGGGMLTVPTGTTTTINGPFDAPLEQVLTLQGTGVVNFGKFAVPLFRPEWWGAKGDCNSTGTSGTDNTLPLQQCFTAAKVTRDLTVVQNTLVKLVPGSKYRTAAVSLAAGVSFDSEGAGLIAGVNLGGFSLSTPLLTIDGSIADTYYKGLTVESSPTGANTHGFAVAYWETNIGVRFTAFLGCNLTVGHIAGWCIGLQFTGGGGGSGVMSYSRAYVGKFDSNKINIDIRTTAINFCNECNFRDTQIQSTSNDCGGIEIWNADQDMNCAPVPGRIISAGDKSIGDLLRSKPSF